MFGNRERMILIENKATSPRYSLSYRRTEWGKTSKKLSYDIISRLVKDNDLLMEVDSSVFPDLAPNDKEKIFEDLLVRLRDLNIEYKYCKRAFPKQTKILGFSVSSSKMDTEHQLLVYVPNDVWVRDGFWELIPEDGVTYHILNRNTDALKLLEEIHSGRLMDEEIREHYEATIFDYIRFGQMGIDTNLSKQELKECLLGLDK